MVGFQYLTRWSKSRKLRDKAYQKAYDANRRMLERAREKLSPAVYQEYLESLVASFVDKNGVEVASWRIHLKSGRVIVAPHSSAEVTGTSGISFLKSFGTLFERYHFHERDIARIEYFHTHPTDFESKSPPLSIADEKIMVELKEILKEELKDDPLPPIEMYAIGKVSGKSFLYKASF
jgi:hypothetical protein